MIIKDNKGTAAVNNTSSIKRVIAYNEDKVNEGVARILFGEFDNNFIETAIRFEEKMEVKKANGIFMHIPISFHPDDKVTDTDMLLITFDYLKEKNVDLGNVVIIEHYDKAHPHLHVVLINRNTEHNYNATFTKMGSVRNTISFCRQKEKEYGYVQVKGNNTKHQNYNETNAIKYSLSKSIQKNEELFLSKFPYLEKELVSLKSKTISNDEFKKDNEKAFFTLYQFAKAHNLLYISRTSRVEELIQNNINDIKKDPYNFEHPELYVRVIKNSYIQYGLKSESFYINESKLPTQYQLNFLKGEKKTTLSSSKIYIKNVLDSFKQQNSTTLDNLKLYLSNNKITVIEHVNSGGVFGLSFKFQEHVHKGSDIGKEYSFSKLIKEEPTVKELKDTDNKTQNKNQNNNQTGNINTSTQAGVSSGVNDAIEDIENRSKNKGR